VNPTTTWSELRSDATRRLEAGGISNPAREARWMLEEIAGARGAEMARLDRDPAPALAVARVDAMVRRRVDGEPLQYVLGGWSFRGIDLFVDARVLIPRPETELTAQLAIDEAVRLGARRDRRSALAAEDAADVVADLGTGSGAIAVAVASELPDTEVWATDISPDALAVARANLAGVGSAAARVRLAQGDWFGALPEAVRGRVRVVVSNPPYVAEPEYAELPEEVSAHEPLGALVSGPTGLEAIERIATAAPQWLEPSGALVVELDPRRADAAIAVARGAGFADVFVARDLTERPRVLVARLG
jgi:release factor glutamine methyltransferase